MSQNTPTTEQGSNMDPLGMSDEAFADLDPSYFEDAADVADEDNTDDQASDSEEPEATDELEDSEDADDEEDDDPQDQADDSEEADDAEEEDQDTDDTDEDGEEDDTQEEGDEDDTDQEDSEDEDSDSDEVDYKAEYEKLMAPFKANGHEMQVKSAEEVRRLMQMGANYNKKMSTLKPSLKTVKLLDKHGLNEESKLNHLIDLSRGDKGAIQKLLKDSGVDPMDLDTDEESEYRPNTYNVDEREMELDEVLETLQDTPTYQKTVELVSNKWDDASKQIIANNPRVLEVLNDHMANGIHGRVSTEVERLRAFGQLTGVSDIEAYKQVGDQMAEEGKFNDLNSQGNTQNKAAQKPPARRTVRKKPDAKLKQKKRAASSTKTKPASKAPADFNPLSMSDEEFEKQFDSNLL